jgi:NRPS condensation-like uncharacterized protein
MRIKGALDVDALKQALQTVVTRHEVLRTTFEAVDGQPTSRVGAVPPPPIAPVPAPFTT